MNRRAFIKTAALAAISAPSLVQATKADQSKCAVDSWKIKRYYVRWNDKFGNSKGVFSSPETTGACLYFLKMCELDGDTEFRYTVTLHHGKELLASRKGGQRWVKPAYCGYT